MCSLNPTKDAIKPNIKSERNTIILREIPSATEPAQVEAIFEGCGKVASVRSDVGDTWFVTMDSEEEAVQTLLALRSKTFNNAPLKARLKSENILKSFYPTQTAESVVATSGASAPYGGRGYYGAASGGYYDVQNSYGVQYNSARQFNGAENNRYAQRGPGGRGAGATGYQQQYRQGNARANNGPASAPHQQTQPKEGRAKSNSFDQQQQQRPNGKKSKDKRANKQTQPPQQPASANGKKAASPASERQPILSAANFPPLPATAEKDAAGNIVIQHKYHHEDIMEIVKHMDEDDCKLQEGKMDFEAHPAALTSIAHPDLLRNQRTYSIEQAREAMRQGRPIRSDSVGSIDYESMMYGEDYTKEAREERKQTAAVEEKTGEKKVAAPSSAPAQPKILSYGAALIHGTPAPAPVVEAKKPAAKAKTPKAAKEEPKKAAKKTTTKTETAVDETLPKAGAWGGRNFLDVVKSEPAAPPAAPVKAAAPANGKKTDAKEKTTTTTTTKRVVESK